MQTYRYLLKKLLFMIPILLLVSVATFILVDCTAGDPARVMLQGSTGNPSEESVQLLQQELGLDQPKIVQYFQWLGNVLRFNFGNSYVSSKPVIWELLNRVPVTLGIAILGIIIVLLISIPLGILAAIRKNTWLDHVIQIFSVFTVCVPAFWLGIGTINFIWNCFAQHEHYRGSCWYMDMGTRPVYCIRLYRAIYWSFTG